MPRLLLSFLIYFAYAQPPTRVLFLGDSLTEGYGVAKTAAFPSVVESDLAKKKPIEAVNGGLSGATSASGPSRLRWHLRAKPTVVVLALGANDGLRGLKLEDSEKNLESTIVLAKQNKLKVLLAGMKVPPNYGADYEKKFEAMFVRLAKKHNVARLPFLLVGVGGVSKLNQADGIHPNEAGHAIVARTVEKYLEPLL